jgi:hypothetical protein
MKAITSGRNPAVRFRIASGQRARSAHMRLRPAPISESPWVKAPIAAAVPALPARPAWDQQAQPVVVVQRPHRDAA